MNVVTGHDIRERFLRFFEGRGHRIVRSSSLVPANDPTLLFTNAGMNQFKDVFLGLEKRDYSRATTSQKCVRAGGKHNDLENVGYTRRHHTFFEMLGNFSFGDYFKADAIEFAWDLITKDYGMPKDRLYVTIYEDDDEAGELWQKVAGVKADRIFKCGAKDNFWQMGDTGPCGPCSELHYDLGPEAAEAGREHEEFPLDGGGRFVEIWNLVFMQFDRSADGTMTPLPKPSIDTGMGLERVAAILQGKVSNYQSDLIAPIMVEAARIMKVEPGVDRDVDTALRVVADHGRATEFLIHDGVFPSNEGRGYVLRKIMRRALRHARRVGVEGHFLHKLTPFIAEFMKPAYPELMESVDRVARVVQEEENRYASAFLVAERVFQDEAGRAAGGVLSGASAFKLYDTFGLPLEEQEEMAREVGLSIDRGGFDEAMEGQRQRARASWKGAAAAQLNPAHQELIERGRTQFLGYDTCEAPEVRVIGLLVDGAPVKSAGPHTEAEIILDRTPFYAEAGGQVGDQGQLISADSGLQVATVQTAYAPIPGLTVHRATILDPVHVGDTLTAHVSEELRRATMRNHTATHLLHAALRTVLGKHVKQAGSLVEPGRLRFDFTHFAALDASEIREVEQLINENILRNAKVETQVLDLDQALESGAMALFGEKYGEKVRVVSIPEFSRELCGGTHVGRTGDIGLCKIVYEGSISAGVRRIEAVTGEGALNRFQDISDSLRRVSGMIRASEPELVEQVERLVAQQRALERELAQMKTKVAQAQAGDLESQAREIGGVRVLASRVDGMDRTQMRELADSLRNKWRSAVVVLASAVNGEVALVAAVTKDLTNKLHAGKIAGSVAEKIGGKGGGRPDMAQAGGKDVSHLPRALEDVYEEVRQAL